MTVKRSVRVVKPQPLRCAEPTPADMELEEDDIAWATRSGIWQSRVAKASARRTKRAKAQPALILAGHGVSLRVENGALRSKMDLRTTRRSEKSSDTSAATSPCRSALFYWMAAAAFPSTFYPGSPNKKSALFALIGRATLSASPAHQDIRPILFGCVGNLKPAKILGREMNIAAR
jgi:hypothetical protein